jgi:ppGpp synthetase/RelA/SpoT-type nucleotidyltranferase
MEKPTLASDQEWVRDQIEAYRLLHPRYETYARVLREILEKAAKQSAAQAIIQSRPKSIPSFAEKAIRKKKTGRYDNPLTRMTDLCGARVIVQTLAEVHEVCDFIEKHFAIDAENTVDVSQRLKPSEFGYRSIHYIVQLKRGVFPTKEIPIEIPEELYPVEHTPMKAEIQVRTLLEHAWAGFVHDRVYKGAFTIPPKWERELAVLAGMLEQTDQSFSRIQAGLRTYTASYGAYLNEEQLKDEMGILESVLTCDPDNADLAYRMGKLAMELGDWQKAIEIFSRYVDTGYQPILRDLGVVLCKVNATDLHGASYMQGQKYLETASASQYKDADALASLAGTWKRIDEEKTRELYRQAYEIDPTDPYAVSNYLVYEIVHQQSMTPASLMGPSLKAAIQRCHDQADVGMNLPWAFYNLGVFHLLLNQPYEALTAYAQAIQLSTTNWMAETSFLLLEKLNVVQTMIQGYEWIRRLLILGRAVKFKDGSSLDQIKNLATSSATSISGPAIILAGGTSEDARLEQYKGLLLEVLHGFHGTLIGGGTTAGISGLVGEIQVAFPKSISSIGYIPATLPEGTEIDKRYKLTRITEGGNFSALEPLQYWFDVVASAMQPAKVKLLGIGGGKISAFEYRLALTLGASVGVVESSGREAARLFSDPHWKNSKNLKQLTDNVESVRSFILPED